MSGITTTVHLLRHGLTNDTNCMRGSTDTELSPAGLLAMEKAITSTPNYDLIISSPLRRCLAFAKQLNDVTNIPLVINKQWQEIDFGTWDGMAYDVLWEKYGSDVSKYWDNPWQHTPPEAESLISFNHRILEAWSNLLDKYQGKNILLITHGGVIRQIIHQTLNLPQDNTHLSRISLPYASLVKISVYCDEDNKDWPQIHF